MDFSINSDVLKHGRAIQWPSTPAKSKTLLISHQLSFNESTRNYGCRQRGFGALPGCPSPEPRAPGLSGLRSGLAPPSEYFRSADFLCLKIPIPPSAPQSYLTPLNTITMTTMQNCTVIDDSDPRLEEAPGGMDANAVMGDNDTYQASFHHTSRRSDSE